jgi:hypothetical protein
LHNTKSGASISAARLLTPGQSQKFAMFPQHRICRSVPASQLAFCRAQRDVQVVYAFDFRLSMQIHPLVTGAKHSSYQLCKVSSLDVSIWVTVRQVFLRHQLASFCYGALYTG